MVLAKLVEKNFSRNPEYYDSFAETQRMVAARLAKMIAEFSTEKEVRRILEMGCGTGFLTKFLFRTFPTAEFAVTDISPAMLAFCERSTAKLADELGVSTEFAVLDASSAVPDANFDLVTSSLVFQWVEDVDALAERLSAALAPGGLLAFATLADGTFGAVSTAFKECETELPMPPLADIVAMERCLSRFGRVELKMELLREEFPSMRRFLSHLHNMGAGNATGNLIPAGALRKVLSRFDAEPVTAEYKVVYALCEK